MERRRLADILQTNESLVGYNHLATNRRRSILDFRLPLPSLILST